MYNGRNGAVLVAVSPRRTDWHQLVNVPCGAAWWGGVRREEVTVSRVTEEVLPKPPQCLSVPLRQPRQTEGGESVGRSQDDLTRPLLYPFKLLLLCEGE